MVYRSNKHQKKWVGCFWLCTALHNVLLDPVPVARSCFFKQNKKINAFAFTIPSVVFLQSICLGANTPNGHNYNLIIMYTCSFVKEEKLDKIPSMMDIMKYNLEEWPYLLFGSIAACVMGLIQPAFAIIFSSIIGVRSVDKLCTNYDQKLDGDVSIFSDVLKESTNRLFATRSVKTRT